MVDATGHSGQRLLVVLSGMDEQGYSADHPVVRRAVDLARRDGQALLLLQVCYENSLSYGAFAPRSQIEAARNAVLAAETEKIVALQQSLAGELRQPVDFEVCWDFDRAAAILRVARAWQPDVVFKEKGDKSFVLGLFSNTDWDLLRESPVPVWFVSARSPRGPESGVLAAVDPAGEGPDAEQHFALDDVVFGQARRLADLYQAPLQLVHAYQLPRGIVGFQGYAPIYPAGMPTAVPVATPQMVEGNRQARDAVARRHGDAIQAFADRHGITPDALEVCEGPAADVIRVMAERTDAGLVVMGAGDKGRWQRLLGRVSAEPALADSPCDVLFVHVPA